MYFYPKIIEYKTFYYKNKMKETQALTVFEQKHIRSVVHEGETFFSVVDIVEVLTESPKPSNYWDTLKRRDNQLSALCGKFKFKAVDGKMRSTECANTKSILRIVQSIPSPKAEPFKLWLSEVGYERIQEIENPELGIDRVQELYRAKGYPDEWIERRLQTIEIRKQLTDEWKQRGVKEGQEYAILTAEIAKATFGLNPSEHKELKGLKQTNENLRDHMTTLELIFTSLGEEMTRALAVDNDAQGFEENEHIAQKGGRAAGKARLAAEKETGVKVVSDKSYLRQLQEEKRGKELKSDAESQKE